MNYIDDEYNLVEICQQLTLCSWVAIDTEFERTKTYYSKLSLIQIYNKHKVYIIDPISIKNLSPLWDFLINPKIIKVFHGARQDIEVLFQHSKKMPRSIFDTQIAAVFLKYGYSVGFAKLVELELNIKLDKSQTRTNWHQRPLTPEQLNYAINDVFYLAPLYEKIIKQLSSKQLQCLAQDFDDLLNPKLYKPSIQELSKKIIGKSRIPNKQKEIVNSLSAWREINAQKQDKPRRWLLKDEAILAIAKRIPKTKEEIIKIPHIKSSDINLYGEQWINAIDNVFADYNSTISSKKPLKQPLIDEQQKSLLSMTKVILQQIALDYNLKINQIITEKQILLLVNNYYQNGELNQTPAIEVLTGWRYYLLENTLKQFFKGKLCLTILDSNSLNKSTIKIKTTSCE